MPRGIKRAGGKRRGRPSAIARIPTADLRSELERRRGMMDELVRQHEALIVEIKQLEPGYRSEDVSNGSAPTGHKRGRLAGSGRRGNKLNLVESLRNLLQGNTLSVVEAADAVKKAGYKSKSANFRVIVNQALLANRKAFRKVGRGQYTAR